MTIAKWELNYRQVSTKREEQSQKGLQESDSLSILGCIFNIGEASQSLVDAYEKGQKKTVKRQRDEKVRGDKRNRDNCLKEIQKFPDEEDLNIRIRILSSPIERGRF
ncbi:hypothetical protein CEXT_421331 [Caerostris extrusa]|uniref:Uncharacterized protein n=1 Tax=Caerostris extrusa TaxID=172846 RepID=A0AAV4WEF0_CAEEX|nr:hypothetical protein CEXT_421331 [Caerostris extrusa]